MKSNMTPRERLRAVYHGETPDCVASLADLSYWHAGNGGGRFIPGKTGDANHGKLKDLLALHRQTGAAIHLNTGSYYRTHYTGGVEFRSGVDGDLYVEHFITPLGELREVRQWSGQTCSWPITRHMVSGVGDLRILRYIAQHTGYAANWELLAAVNRMVGEIGLPLVQVPYTGMGFFISRYAGVEQTVLLAADEPDEFQETLDCLNRSHREVVRLMAEGPSEVLMVSDNLSADVQSPPWFRRYSSEHYRWMAQTAHACGKPIVSHIDGRLRGLLGLSAELGIDGGDAVTPAPWGDLTPRECREEAGDAFILSGGVPPDHFHPEFPIETFDAAVEAWLALADRSSALIIAPGDQLPPDGDPARVTRMVEMANARRY